eukprot:293548-Pyramimonas_sp.AAC.1
MPKEGNASARYRRTALDLAVICEALEHVRGSARWIPHGRVPVDMGRLRWSTKITTWHFAETERPGQKDRSQSASKRIFNNDDRLVALQEFMHCDYYVRYHYH